jgi:hypothetical protein
MGADEEGTLARLKAALQATQTQASSPTPLLYWHNPARISAP